jgi:hypothetical protein
MSLPADGLDFSDIHEVMSTAVAIYRPFVGIENIKNHAMTWYCREMPLEMVNPEIDWLMSTSMQCAQSHPVEAIIFSGPSCSLLY